MSEEYVDFRSDKYASIQLSQGEKEVFDFLNNAYGITYDEFVSIVLWLGNFGIKLEDVKTVEDVELSLMEDFNLTADDIYTILFQHGDIFSKAYQETKDNFEFLSTNYNASKADFIQMLKSGAVINKKEVLKISFELKSKLEIKSKAQV